MEYILQNLFIVPAVLIGCGIICWLTRPLSPAGTKVMGWLKKRGDWSIPRGWDRRIAHNTKPIQIDFGSQWDRKPTTTVTVQDCTVHSFTDRDMKYIRKAAEAIHKKLLRREVQRKAIDQALAKAAADKQLMDKLNSI